MNPVLALLQGNQSSRRNDSNFMYDAVTLLRTGKNADSVIKILGEKYPEFKEFAERNQNKSPDEIAKENNIDMSKIMK